MSPSSQCCTPSEGRKNDEAPSESDGPSQNLGVKCGWFPRGSGGGGCGTDRGARVGCVAGAQSCSVRTKNFSPPSPFNVGFPAPLSRVTSGGSLSISRRERGQKGKRVPNRIEASGSLYSRALLMGKGMADSLAAVDRGQSAGRLYEDMQRYLRFKPCWGCPAPPAVGGAEKFSLLRATLSYPPVPALLSPWSLSLSKEEDGREDDALMLHLQCRCGSFLRPFDIIAPPILLASPGTGRGEGTGCSLRVLSDAIRDTGALNSESGFAREGVTSGEPRAVEPHCPWARVERGAGWGR